VTMLVIELIDGGIEQVLEMKRISHQLVL